MSHIYLKQKCDRLCYQILLLRDVKCQRCGSAINLVTSHCYGKKTWPPMRHELDNLLLLCHFCHSEFWHYSMDSAWVWFDDKWPERSKRLLEISRKKIKLNRVHYKDKAEELQQEYDRLKVIPF